MSIGNPTPPEGGRESRAGPPRAATPTHRGPGGVVIISRSTGRGGSGRHAIARGCAGMVAAAMAFAGGARGEPRWLDLARRPGDRWMLLQVGAERSKAQRRSPPISHVADAAIVALLPAGSTQRRMLL